MEFSDLGVVFAEGRKCWMKGLAKLSGLEKITECKKLTHLMLTGNRLKPTPELEVLDPLVSYLL